MEAAFWLERWQRGETGFHQRDVNPDLQQHWPTLGVPRGSTVFVPLCGKSVDMLWLRAQGLEVVGVELAAQAVDEFFAGQQLTPARSERHGLPWFEADGIGIYCGDFFALGAAALSRVAAVYDRAALVALPPPTRLRYADHLLRVLPASAPILQLTMEYEQSQMHGPPFAVNAAELQELYGARYTIERLSARNTLDAEPRFRERGLRSLQECCYRLRPANG